MYDYLLTRGHCRTVIWFPDSFSTGTVITEPWWVGPTSRDPLSAGLTRLLYPASAPLKTPGDFQPLAVKNQWCVFQSLSAVGALSQPSSFVPATQKRHRPEWLVAWRPPCFRGCCHRVPQTGQILSFPVWGGGGGLHLLHQHVLGVGSFPRFWGRICFMVSSQHLLVAGTSVLPVSASAVPWPSPCASGSAFLGLCPNVLLTRTSLTRSGPPQPSMTSS